MSPDIPSEQRVRHPDWWFIAAIVAIVAAVIVVGVILTTGSADDQPPAESSIEPGWTRVRAPDDFGDVAISPCVAGLRILISEDDTRATSSLFALPCGGS